jgi:hypothetical protein
VPAKSGRILRVVGAHPGAGTTTVAVAVVDALATATPSAAVALVDPHPAEASGLVCAADRELGVTETGWLLGQRGPIAVYRRPAATARVAALEQLPCPTPDVERVIVVDHGTADPTDQPLAQRRSSLHRPAGLVLVCRASVPGGRRAELVLHRHGEAGWYDLVVVLVGNRRLPAVVRAAMGPRLRALHDGGRTVLVPAHRRLSVEGVDDRPLPAPVVQAGLAILRLAVPDLLDRPSTRSTSTSAGGRR